MLRARRIRRRPREYPCPTGGTRCNRAARACRAWESAAQGATWREPFHLSWLARCDRCRREPARMPRTRQRARKERRTGEWRALLKASGFLDVVRRGRQNGRPIRGRLLLLHFQFGSKNGRGSGGDRHIAGFGAAVTVEDFRGVAGGDDFRQRGERRSDDIHTANELIRPAIGKDLVDHEGFHLERLRLAAGGGGEPPR